MIRTEITVVILLCSFFIQPASLCSQTPELSKGEEKTYTLNQIQADFEALIRFIEDTHPRLDYSVDMQEYNRTQREIKAQISAATRRQVWSLFAQLNPVFNDGHLGLMIPETQADTLLVGSSVEILNNKIYIYSEKLDNRVSVRSIGNVQMDSFLDSLNGLVRGESEGIKNFVVQKRFYAYLDLFNVDPLSDPWIIRVGNEERSANYADLKINQPAEDPLFEFDALNDNIVRLRIDSFEKKYLTDFEFFLENSFSRISEMGVNKIIIDLTENGGGSREPSDALLSFLTQNKYTPTSKVSARVHESNHDRLQHLSVGDTVTLPYPQWVTPKKRNVFKGEIYVLVSEKTYSQAIVFSTIVQDFGIGTIIGEETGGKANQTGQVQYFTLPNTGFKVVCPLYVLYRAKNSGINRGVIPEVLLRYPISEEELLDAVSRD